MDPVKKLIDVELDDGTLIVDVPEGTTKAEVQRRYTLGQQAGMTHPAKPSEPSFLETMIGLGKAAGTGVAKTAAATVGLPGDVQEMAAKLPESKTFGKFEPVLQLPSTKNVREAVGGVTGLSLHKPQNILEQYTESTAGGAASLFNPFNPMGKAGPLFGAALGGFGEAGAQAVKEQPELGRLGVQIPMMILAAYPALKLPQVVKAVRDYLQELGPSGLSAAEIARQVVEKKLGVPSILTQGIDNPGTALSGITQMIKTEPRGMEIRKRLDAQLPAAQAKIEELVSALSARGLDQEAANKIVMAGKTATYSQPREAVQKATAPLYQAATRDKMPLFGAPGEPSIQEIVNSILSKTHERSLDLAPAKKVGERTIKTLSGLEQPPRVTELDVLARNAADASRASYKEGARPKEVSARQGQDIVAEAINEATKARSPALAGGKMVNVTGQEWIRKPAAQGALGQMFPETMANKGTADFGTLAKSLPDNAEDVRTIAQGLGKTDPEAFPSLVQKDWRDKIDKLSETTSGRAPVSFLNDVPNALQGAKGSQKAAAFDAKVEEIARMQGLDPVAARESANELMDALRIASREQGGKGAISADTKYDASASIVTRFLRSLSLTSPFRGIGWWMEKQNYGHVVDELTQALTSENGLKKLIEISEYSGKAHKAKTVSRALMSLETQSQQ